MTLLEMLARPEVKKMYKELVKKFHPDVGGNPDIMKKVNNAKDEGDEEMIDLYNELVLGKKSKGPAPEPIPQEKKSEEPEEEYRDIGLESIKKDMKKYSSWGYEIEHHIKKTLNKHCLITVVAVQPTIGKWKLNSNVFIFDNLYNQKPSKMFTIFDIQRFSSKQQFMEKIYDHIK